MAKPYNNDLETVLRNGRGLKNVKEKTYSICLNAVQQDGTALEFVTDQTYRLCKIAVKQTRHALAHVILDKLTANEYFNICLSANCHIEGCLDYVDSRKLTAKQYYMVCLIAIKHGYKDPFSVINNHEFSDEQYFNLCSATVNRIGIYIRQVKSDKLTVTQYRELCNIAVKKDSFAKRYINLPLPLGDPVVVIDMDNIIQTS